MIVLLIVVYFEAFLIFKLNSCLKIIRASNPVQSLRRLFLILLT